MGFKAELAAADEPDKYRYSFYGAFTA